MTNANAGDALHLYNVKEVLHDVMSKTSLFY